MVIINLLDSTGSHNLNKDISALRLQYPALLRLSNSLPVKIRLSHIIMSNISRRLINIPLMASQMTYLFSNMAFYIMNSLISR